MQDVAAELVGRVNAGLSQHARLITLQIAHDNAPRELLVAESMVAHEAVNDLFRFDIDALGDAAQLDLSALQGEELTVTLLQPDGTRRAWHGICTAARLRGDDGGVARCRLRLEPALSQLRLRHDSYIFQNQDARGIVGQLLRDYPQVRCEFDVSLPLPVHPICTQYRESDLAFFQRLLAAEGLSYRFEHGPPGLQARYGKHTLIVFDSRAPLPPMPGGDTIRFHGVRATDTDDAIDCLGARRELHANVVTFSSWAPSLLVAPASQRQSALEAGDLPQLSIYDGSGERLAADRSAADARTGAMLLAAERHYNSFEGTGAVRRLAAGHRFTLSQHERFPAGMDAFTVLAVRHEARNNFSSALRSAGGIEPGTYRNEFTCVRASVPIVPSQSLSVRPRTAPGPQSAQVVGLASSAVTTNRDHAVRVQFAWQRGHRPNLGGLPHDQDQHGNAPGDDGSGTWVRVAEALAGPNWGTQFTPRIGSEVLVDFIEGDIDRPVVVSQLYNGAQRPPFPGGVDSGADHAGTLSGMHSRTFDDAGYNQWVLDDTAGQLRMRLATSCAATQLNLGYLVEQAPASAKRGAYRGSGFELRTDAWIVMRGGEGVLLTTSRRAAKGCSVESTQLDAGEALAGLGAARQLTDALGEAAGQQQALFSDDARQALEASIDLVDPAASGKHPASVNGQDAFKPKDGARELDPAAPVEKFGAPLVLLDSAAGINWASPASTVVYAGQCLHWTTRGDGHFSAGYAVSSVSGAASSLFTHDGGITAVAANGPVSLEAHTDGLEILADREIVVTSVNGDIDVKARSRVALHAGKSSITLEGGNITFACPGTFMEKSNQHSFDSPHSSSIALGGLPDTRIKTFSQQDG